jgi:hypothetical protein
MLEFDQLGLPHDLIETMLFWYYTQFAYQAILLFLAETLSRKSQFP